jgi:xanthine dehydrogenase accessory factor
MRRDILDQVAALRSAGEPFALATVVRTASVTAAKAGAKAVIRADGSIVDGWIGGGCARGAVLKAAREAMADGTPRLISVSPDDVLAERGVSAGEERDGIRFARSMCPSKGTMDVFIEPVLPRPELVVLGTSPVALALADLAPRFGFDVTGCAAEADIGVFAGMAVIAGYDLPVSNRARYLVVATQGRGDEAALRGALAAEAAYTAFVGSRRKMSALRAKLTDVPADRLDEVEAPAGLDIGAITPEEIALSILAGMVRHRRQGQRRAEGI